jgi:hypothetical protein
VLRRGGTDAAKADNGATSVVNMSPARSVTGLFLHASRTTRAPGGERLSPGNFFSALFFGAGTEVWVVVMEDTYDISHGEGGSSWEIILRRSLNIVLKEN